jgi:hypothetical protein
LNATAPAIAIATSTRAGGIDLPDRILTRRNMRREERLKQAVPIHRGLYAIR